MTYEPDIPTLEWTGERYVPEIVGNIRLEHVHRYLLARELSKDRRVLDIACGEGYGSDLMAGVAAHVIGVDIDPNAIEHASRRYARPNLEFFVGSCAEVPIADSSVDLVISFETIEHHDDHDEMMREIRRVLRPAGVLVISSPDRREYSEIPGYKNPFHVRELYREELEALLTAHFRHVDLAGQRIRAGSIVGPLGSAPNTAFYSFSNEEIPQSRTKGLSAPLYFIALATDGDMPQMPTGILDGGEFVWSHDHLIALESVRAREAALTEAVESARAREAMLTARIGQIEEARAELAKNLDILEKSCSWRLTAPLRALRRLASRVAPSNVRP
jgi:SAM-dependent methyltransferase